MATGGDVTYEDRMLEGQRAIWREVHDARLALQLMLLLQVVLLVTALVVSLVGD
jgi:hypothetical protein